MKRTALIVAAILLLAGCGGSSHTSSPSTQERVPHSTTATTSRASTEQAANNAHRRALVRAAVRAALLANHRLAIRVLWTNRIPANAIRSTRGSALAGMRASARDRQRRGVRVRMVHDNYRIKSISLARSLRQATAVVESIQTVALTHLSGRTFGRSVELHERGRVVVHRLGMSNDFVVWSISLLK